MPPKPTNSQSLRAHRPGVLIMGRRGHDPLPPGQGSSSVEIPIGRSNRPSFSHAQRPRIRPTQLQDRRRVEVMIYHGVGPPPTDRPTGPPVAPQAGDLAIVVGGDVLHLTVGAFAADGWP
jgi:hypothetical protein